MQHNPSAETTEERGLRNCPTCGTPYPEGDRGLGCPVCQFRRLLEPEDAAIDEGRFEHYEVALAKDGAFDELGRGAMGVTYKAWDTVLDHSVALKVINARIASHPQARERFLREARAAARVRHPNVASVFYYGVRKSDGQCFYAMEFVAGETLEARIRRAGPLPPALALEVTTQVAKALAAAQAQGLVHRDLKPSNLMLTLGPEFAVKLIDFGLVRAAVTVEADSTREGFVGTPAFASPEQCTDGKVDIRSDMYALGVMLWEMVMGHGPFRGSPAELVHQHQHAPLPLDQLKGVPQPVIVLIEALLQKDPRRRLQSPGELLKLTPTLHDAIDRGDTVTAERLSQMLAGDSYAETHRLSERLGPPKISIARLPVTGSNLLGREEELAFLDEAWRNPETNVVTIVAWAGVGKSTLINHWLRRMAVQHYRYAELVFGWSFYRQGSGGGTSSADEFLDAALAWFGDPDPRIGTAWEKGERLASLIAHRRTLLVLDGLEPLQYPPGPQEGRLREGSLQALLRELAAFNTGLCVVTTRLPVADIGDYEHTSAPQRELMHLSSDAGAKLLRALGVKGDDAELRGASQEFDGHCLALTLLGSYLTDACNGEIRHREEISQHLTHDVRHGARAQGVMEFYETWFGEGPELSLLRMLGLFDRPADDKALTSLLKPPVIHGLTESLANLTPPEWRRVVAGLRRARLLVGEDPHNPRNLDAHPLIREYFGEQLRDRLPEAWRESNRRLYMHYRTLAPPLPDSVVEMEPLFRAVICGCKAGLVREALHNIYIPRIQRGNVSFAANILGARGTLLSVLVHFFERGRWGTPITTGVEEQRLTPEDQLFLLMEAAFNLTATRGMALPEARVCYERAESLCHSLNRPQLLYATLMGQWRYSFQTEKLGSATMPIAKRVYSLAQMQNDPALLIGALSALERTHYHLGNFQAARECAKRAVQLWRSGAIQSRVEELIAPAVMCLCEEAQSSWHLEEIETCRASTTEAISLAKELNDTHTLAMTITFAAVLNYYERCPAEAERLASEAIEMSTRHSFAQWLTYAKICRGWARSALGDTANGLPWIEEGIKEYMATGSKLAVPEHLALKAEALYFADRTYQALETIRQAEAVVEETEERSWLAELRRLRGIFLAAIGAHEAEIEASFAEAIRIAGEQKSTSLQKRAEVTRAEYRRQKCANVSSREIRLPV